MKDRLPTYPGRVTLTPVAGQANTYDMVRADEPTEEGTPLNKASLLKDTTAALFGLTAAAVPDEVLQKVKALINGNTSAINDLAASGPKIQTGSYVGTGTYGSSKPCSLTFDFVPQLVILAGVGGNGSSSIVSTYAISLVQGMSSIQYMIDSPYSAYLLLSWSGNTVNWWFNNTDSYNGASQFNQNGSIYRYVALG